MLRIARHSTTQTPYAGSFDGLTTNIVAGIVVALLLAVLAAVWRSKAFRAALRRWADRAYRTVTKILRVDDSDSSDEWDPETLRCFAYMAHLRDVARAFDKLPHSPSKGLVSDVSRVVLGPIPSNIPHEGHRMTAFWLRPNPSRTELHAVEAIGASIEDIGSLPIEKSLAGIAFRTGTPQVLSDCDGDDRVYRLFGKPVKGSLGCFQMRSQGSATGVLAVWSPVSGDLDRPEELYLKGLAAAIGSLERFLAPAFAEHPTGNELATE